MSCNFYLSGGLFAGMLGKALFRWKKGRLKLCFFSLEIGKTGVIVKILINKPLVVTNMYYCQQKTEE